MASYETQCAVDQMTGLELYPEACSAFWGQLTESEQGQILQGYQLAAEDDERTSTVSDLPPDGEVIPYAYECKWKETGFRLRTTLYFTAFRYRLKCRICGDGASNVRPPTNISAFFKDVNAAFKVDNNWGGSAKGYKVLDNYRVSSSEWQITVQSHIENCVTKYGCVWDYYPHITAIAAADRSLTKTDWGRS